MANYVKVEDMFNFIFEYHTFDRLVNKIIRCCTGFMWNNTIGDCIGVKGIYIRYFSPYLTNNQIQWYTIYNYLIHFTACELVCES